MYYFECRVACGVVLYNRGPVTPFDAFIFCILCDSLLGSICSQFHGSTVSLYWFLSPLFSPFSFLRLCVDPIHVVISHCKILDHAFVLKPNSSLLCH